jgi:hypothetical protein
MFFQSVFQCPASNIQSLTVNATMFHTPLSTVLSKIIVLKPNTSELIEMILYLETDELDLVALVGPVEEDSTLKCLDLGWIDTVERVDKIFSNIPRLRGPKKIACSFTENPDENKRLLKRQSSRIGAWRKSVVLIFLMAACNPIALATKLSPS